MKFKLNLHFPQKEFIQNVLIWQMNGSVSIIGAGIAQTV